MKRRGKMKIYTFLLIVLNVLILMGTSYGQYKTLLYDGLEREYVLHCPPSCDGSSTVPLIIGLHGGGSSSNTFESNTELSLKADIEGFIVVYPNAAVGGWNAGGDFSNTIDDVGFIAAIIDTLSREYAIDSRRIYATGFSLGSLMTYRLAAELSDKIAAVAPVAGQMALEHINPSRPVPIIHFQDIYDPRVPFDGGYLNSGSYLPSIESVMNVWIEINECNSDPDTVFNQDGVVGRKWSASSTHADIILYTLTRGGHYWPKSIISASDLMWDFFVTHPILSEYPSPYFMAEPRTGHAPLDVQFTDRTTAMQPLTSWSWDFHHDDMIDSQEQHPLWTYDEPGIYTVSLSVTCNSLSQTATRQEYVYVFNGESAVQFDGKKSYISCPSSLCFNLIDTFTIEAWINPTGWGEFPHIGFAKIVDKKYLTLSLVDSYPSCNHHSLLFNMMHDDGLTSYLNSPSHSIVLNEWQHVAVSYNGTDRVQIYINGIEQEVAYLTSPSGYIKDNTDVDFMIGNSPDLGGTFCGLIDEVRLWDGIRSVEEIQRNMSNHLCGNEYGLIGNWKMDEGNGDTVIDNSPKGNDGRVVDAAWREGIHLEPAVDSDTDKIVDCYDNCPHEYNPGQSDVDNDGVGDVCDNCPGDFNPNQVDIDNDGIGDVCDSCTDTDGDGYGNPNYAANTCDEDNCPDVYNQDQAPADRGDINCTDGINVLDVLSVVNHILGITPLTGNPLNRADCTRDGKVDVLDVVGIVNVVLGIGVCEP